MKKGELIVSILDNKMSKHYTQGGEETKGCENPEAVYIYLRELTCLNTKKVVNQLNKMRKKYRVFKRFFT